MPVAKRKSGKQYALRRKHKIKDQTPVIRLWKCEEWEDNPTLDNVIAQFPESRPLV